MLQPGNTGSDVINLQDLLYAISYYNNRADVNPGKIDGVYGSNTKNAVINFQMSVGLQPTGIADDATLNAIAAVEEAGLGALPPKYTGAPVSKTTTQPPALNPNTLNLGNWQIAGIIAAVFVAVMFIFDEPPSSGGRKK